MKLVLLLLFVAGPTLDGADTAHIRTAVTAYHAGKAALLRKQHAAAIELLSKAIQIEPTYLDAYKALIEARLASGDRLQAAEAITRFLEIEPDEGHYRLLLGQILLAAQQWDKSLAQFTFVLRDDPFNADALWGFAGAAKNLGMQDRASDALAKGHDRYPLDKRFSKR